MVPEQTNMDDDFTGFSISIGDELHVTPTRQIDDSHWNVVFSRLPKGWDCKAFCVAESNIQINVPFKTRVIIVNPIIKKILVSNSNFGFLPISDSMRSRYVEATRTLLSILGSKHVPSKTDADFVSEVKGMFSRCFKKDQHDWFDVYVHLGRPDDRKSLSIAALLYELARSLRNELFEDVPRHLCEVRRWEVTKILEQALEQLQNGTAPVTPVAPTIDRGDPPAPPPTQPLKSPNDTPDFNGSTSEQGVRAQVRLLSHGEVKNMSAEDVLKKLGLWNEVEYRNTDSVFDASSYGRHQDNGTFPEEPIDNLETLKLNTQGAFHKAHKVEYEKLLRSIRTSRGNDKERIEWRYKGWCQMCEKKLPAGHHATGIFYLPEKEIEQMNLSLCPNHASEYQKWRREAGFKEELTKKILAAASSDDLCVSIPKGRGTLRFTATHLAEIQEILKLQAHDTGEGKGETAQSGGKQPSQ